jgi:hypothetical protein
VNTVYPSTQVDPNRTVEHDPPLDERSEPVPRYTVANHSSPVTVEWTDVDPYHLQWRATGTGYTQRIANVDTDGAQVLRNGDNVAATRQNGTLTIPTDANGTFDVYLYDNLEIRSDLEVRAPAGSRTNLTVRVYNPNPFTVHDVHPLVGSSWVYDTDPYEQDIAPNETATYTVIVEPPAGATSASYELPLGLTSSETGVIDTEDATVRVGGTGALVSGTGDDRLLIVLGALVLLLLLGILTAWQEGSLEDLWTKINEI